ncbi:unnamed protein product [Closterium sp. NIES-65]|nr:unnamed protein product [Closterium sp. NIES-65]
MSHAPYAPSPSRAPCSIVARSPHLPCPASSHTVHIIDACSVPIINARGLPIVDARARPAIDVRVPTAHRCPSPCRPALPPRGRPPLPSRGRPASPPCRHLPLPSWYASICLVYPTSALSAHSICLFNIPLLSSLHPPLCASPSFFHILPLRICCSCLLVAGCHLVNALLHPSYPPLHPPLLSPSIPPTTSPVPPPLSSPHQL